LAAHLKKLARNPVAWVAVGSFLFLFFVLLPLVAVLMVDLDEDGGRAGRDSGTTQAAEAYFRRHLVGP
jgi:hypothetical protein